MQGLVISVRRDEGSVSIDESYDTGSIPNRPMGYVVRDDIYLYTASQDNCSSRFLVQRWYIIYMVRETQ